jgi:hypothetical protein
MLSVLPVVACVLMMSGPARAQEFSADMVSREGNIVTNAKIFAAQDKFRMEMPDSVIIMRIDKGLTWMVMPAEKMYMENPIDQGLVPHVSETFSGETERVAMGTEAIDGENAEKFQVTFVENGKTETVYQWLRGPIVVKIEAIDQSWSTEYKNIVTGPQAADLFEPPADYEKMVMPSMGEMLKGLGNMMP